MQTRPSWLVNQLVQGGEKVEGPDLGEPDRRALTLHPHGVGVRVDIENLDLPSSIIAVGRYEVSLERGAGPLSRVRQWFLRFYDEFPQVSVFTIYRFYLENADICWANP
jgi:hypothetical protein